MPSLRSSRVSPRLRLCRAVRTEARSRRAAVGRGEQHPYLAVLALRAFTDGLFVAGEGRGESAFAPGLADARAVADAACDAICPDWRRRERECRLGAAPIAASAPPSAPLSC